MIPQFRNALTLVVALLVSACDAGGGGSVTDSGTPATRPTNGISGTAAKGIISGATITVTDAAGGSVAIASGGETNEDGTFEVIFTEAAVAAGIIPPLTVTITGGSATCDFDKPATDNDCGTGIPFGATYALPEGFELDAVIPSLPANTAASIRIVTANITPATDLAATIANASAAGSALTEAEVIAANRQVLGLIQALTGVDMSNSDLNEIPVVDVTDPSAGASDSSYALMAFAIAMIAEIDPTDPDGDTLIEVIARLKSELGISQDTGNLVATGFALGRLSSSIASALTTINSQLEVIGVTRSTIVAAQANAERNASTYISLGSAVVGIPDTLNPDAEATPLDLTKQFVAALGNAITSIMSSTGAQGFSLGATELFASELNAVRKLGSAGTTIALRQLETNIIGRADALAPGNTEVDIDTTDGVVGTMSKSADGNTVIIANTTSTFTDETNGTTTRLQVPDGVRESNATLLAESIIIETTQNDVVLQKFTGRLDAQFAAEAGDIGLTSLALQGDIVGEQPNSAFTLDLLLSNLSGITSEAASGRNVSGSYVGTIGFESTSDDNLSVTLRGELHAYEFSFDLVAGSTTLTGTASRSGDTSVTTFTDGSATLTVTLDHSQGPGRLVSAFLSVGTGETATQTGNINSSGVVFFSDGSVISLPASVF
jgi:hypothetical protein